MGEITANTADATEKRLGEVQVYRPHLTPEEVAELRAEWERLDHLTKWEIVKVED